jgi:hypothetical protein
LPAWNDCSRRVAAQLFRIVINSAGYKIRKLDSNVGAIVGRATHSAAAFMLKTKIEDGTLGDEAEAGACAIESFETNLADSTVIWDDATPGRNDGERQVLRMVRSYRAAIAPNINPESVEKRLECDLGDGFILSGQPDQVVREFGGNIRDLKTGTGRRANGVQYGTYSLLVRAHGGAVEKLIEDYVPRVRLKNPQPDPESIEHDVVACEHAARETIGDMKRSLTEFVRRLQSGGSPPEGAFQANPMSMLCSEKYCSAHSTPFCRLHKGAVV